MGSVSISPCSTVLHCVSVKRCMGIVGCSWIHGRGCRTSSWKWSVLGKVIDRWRPCRFRSVNGWKKMRLSGPGFLKILIWLKRERGRDRDTERGRDRDRDRDGDRERNSLRGNPCSGGQSPAQRVLDYIAVQVYQIQAVSFFLVSELVIFFIILTFSVKLGIKQPISICFSFTFEDKIPKEIRTHGGPSS